LTRKLMEKIHIGDEICVTVVRIEGGQVRLGIDAPRNVPVLRDEIRTRIAAKPNSGSEVRIDAPLKVRIDAPPGTDIRPRAPSR